MEKDRYAQHHWLFIISMICLLISLSLLFFALFLLPHLLFGWRYEVPAMITYMREWVIFTFNYTHSGASRLLFFILIGLTLLFGFIAYLTSTRIDEDLLAEEIEPKSEEGATLDLGPEIERLIPPPPKKTHYIKESMPYVYHVLGIIFLVSAAMFMLHWFVSG